jgi:hypothetical protein
MSLSVLVEAQAVLTFQQQKRKNKEVDRKEVHSVQQKPSLSRVHPRDWSRACELLLLQQASAPSLSFTTTSPAKRGRSFAAAMSTYTAAFFAYQI